MKNFLFITVILFSFACSEEDMRKAPLTYDHFKANLTAEMTYADFVDFFGEPTKDIGSGIHMYVYELSDATEIWIGYADEIIYARHVDENGLLLEEMIE